MNLIQAPTEANLESNSFAASGSTVFKRLCRPMCGSAMHFLETLDRFSGYARPFGHSPKRICSLSASHRLAAHRAAEPLKSSLRNLRNTDFYHFLLSILLLALLAVIASAQSRGVISGRVVNDEGAGLPGVTLSLEAIATGSSSSSGGSATKVTSDAEGNFQFTNLTQRSYSISVQSTRGYVRETVSVPNQPQLYRVGDNVTIRMVKGGVITGRVTDANGNPVIGVFVSAIRTRDAEGMKVDVSFGGRLRLTDDRGVYRIYGLRPGTYLVVANSGRLVMSVSAYGDQSPTYYPSSTQDTAVPITLVAGAEMTGIDIQHRRDPGYVVSGKILGGNTRSGTMIPISTVTIYSVQTGAPAGLTYSQQLNSESGFAMFGIADGEYEIVASNGGTNEDNYFRSEPRRITVRGADVTGLELRLTPMAVIAGNVVLEPKPVCTPSRKTDFEEIAVTTKLDEKPKAESLSPVPIYLPTIAANEKGEFRLVNLRPGRHRLEARLPNENLFIKSITAKSADAAPATSTTANSKPVAATDLARSGALLKPGERLTGVTVAIADGAASLRGKAVAAQNANQPLSPLRIHLIPAEPTATDDVLRYGEVLTSDGSFAFTNFAPGKYWLLAKPVADNESADRLPPPIAWDAAEPLKLRKAAEAAKTEIELKACQRVKDHVLRW